MIDTADGDRNPRKGRKVDRGLRFPGVKSVWQKKDPKYLFLCMSLMDF